MIIECPIHVCFNGISNLCLDALYVHVGIYVIIYVNKDDDHYYNKMDSVLIIQKQFLIPKYKMKFD